MAVGDGESLALPVPSPRTTRPRGDAALLRAADRGDRAALAELFDRHWPALHRAAWLVCHDAQAAEDIAQEAFLAALARLDRFDRRRPLGPWLHRIAVNRAIDHVRARAARHEVASPPDHDAPAPAPGAPRRAARRAVHARRPTSAPSSCSVTCSAMRPARSPPARAPARHRQLAPAAGARRTGGGAGAMSVRRTAARLASAPVPDAAGAAARARAVVLAAARRAAPMPRRRGARAAADGPRRGAPRGRARGRRPRRAGAAVGEWVQRQIDRRRPPRRKSCRRGACRRRDGSCSTTPAGCA